MYKHDNPTPQEILKINAAIQDKYQMFFSSLVQGYTAHTLSELSLHAVLINMYKVLGVQINRLNSTNYSVSQAELHKESSYDGVCVWYCPYVNVSEIPLKEHKLDTGKLMENPKHFVRIIKNAFGGRTILTNKLTPTLVDRILCMIPLWYPDKNLEEVLPILKSFMLSKYDDMIDSSNIFYRVLEEREKNRAIDKWLEDTKSYETDPVYHNTNKELNRLDQDITCKEESLREMYSRRLKIRDKLIVLIHKERTIDEVLLSAYKNNKHITNFYKGNNYLSIQVKAPVTDYSENYASILYKSSVSNTSVMEKAILKKVFIDRDYTLYFEESWNLNQESFDVYCTSDRYVHYLLAMRNTHMSAYSCYDTYRSYVTKALENGDYVSMLAYIVTATGSLNLADPPVIAKLFTSLADDYDDYPHTIQDNRTGKWVTPQDIVKEYTNEISKNESERLSETNNQVNETDRAVTQTTA